MMKKLLAVLLVGILMLSLCACGDDLGKQTIVDDEHGVVEFNTVGFFDYSDFKKEHKDTAKTEGFKNTTEQEFHNKNDAKKLAKNELPEGYSYNTLKLFYDRTEGVWLVEFSTVNEDDNSVSKKYSVCVEETGFTILAVEEK